MKGGLPWLAHQVDNCGVVLSNRGGRCGDGATPQGQIHVTRHGERRQTVPSWCSGGAAVAYRGDTNAFLSCLH